MAQNDRPHAPDPAPDPAPDIAALQRRMALLESELQVMRLLVARIALHADPRARVAIVKFLTGQTRDDFAPGTTPEQRADIEAAARAMLKLIAN